MDNPQQQSQMRPPVNPAPLPVNNPSRPKAPLLVIIMSWLMLFDGLSKSLGSLIQVYLVTSISRFETSFLTSEGIADIAPSFSINYISVSIKIVLGIGVVIAAFGLRYMRRWALYAFTVLTIIMVISLVYSYLISTKQNLSNVFAGVMQILILIYFWIISKKFV